jgi:acetyl-CoA carboxylase biotin carboxyl carrier protein
MNENLIFTLMDKLDRSGLAELDFSDGASRLVLRKAGAGSAAAAGAAAGPRSAGDMGGSAGVPGGTGDQDTSGGVSAGSEIITSPIVGTFYSASSPDAPPFVRQSSKVKAGDTLCILEAMKMMNRLVAEFDCEILAVKAASGDMVEFGQALFEVKRLDSVRPPDTSGAQPPEASGTQPPGGSGFTAGVRPREGQA